MSVEKKPRGRKSLGRERIIISLPPDMIAFLNNRSKERASPRSTIVEEIIRREAARSACVETPDQVEHASEPLPQTDQAPPPPARPRQVVVERFFPPWNPEETKNPAGGVARIEDGDFKTDYRRAGKVGDCISGVRVMVEAKIGDIVHFWQRTRESAVLEDIWMVVEEGGAREVSEYDAYYIATGATELYVAGRQELDGLEAIIGPVR